VLGKKGEQSRKTQSSVCTSPRDATNAKKRVPRNKGSEVNVLAKKVKPIIKKAHPERLKERKIRHTSEIVDLRSGGS